MEFKCINDLFVNITIEGIVFLVYVVTHYC
jgi:hypothetical protein